MKPIIFTLEVCPNCMKLKEALKEEGIEYDEKDMESGEGITELRFGGCFAMEAPVLQIGEVFAESSVIFRRGAVDMQYVKELIKTAEESV